MFFELIGLPNGGTDGDSSDDALKVIGPKRFDTKHKRYKHPKSRHLSPILRDFLIDEGNCGSFDLDTSLYRYFVVATNKINGLGKYGKTITSTFGVRQIRASADIAATVQNRGRHLEGQG